MNVWRWYIVSLLTSTSPMCTHTRKGEGICCSTEYLFTLFFQEINPPDLSFWLLSGLGFVLTPHLGNLLLVLLFVSFSCFHCTELKEDHFFEKCSLLRISVPVEKDRGGGCVWSFWPISSSCSMNCHCLQTAKHLTMMKLASRVWQVKNICSKIFFFKEWCVSKFTPFVAAVRKDLSFLWRMNTTFLYICIYYWKTFVFPEQWFQVKHVDLDLSLPCKAAAFWTMSWGKKNHSSVLIKGTEVWKLDR